MLKTFDSIAYFNIHRICVNFNVIIFYNAVKHATYIRSVSKTFSENFEGNVKHHKYLELYKSP